MSPVQALVHDEMCRVYGSGSVQAVVPVYNTAALDTAATKYWQLTGQFEGEAAVQGGKTYCTLYSTGHVGMARHGGATGADLYLLYRSAQGVQGCLLALLKK